MNEKIKEEHLQRTAILYVRQSSTFQVMNNHESRRLQYAMKKRLQEYGWESIEVIDDDLGITASGKAERSGFERMLTAVFMGTVGALAALELSRFARNSRDWQQLIEVCKMVNTLLIDSDAVYNPSSGNDRLLLGVKGSLAEYELDILHQRSVAARAAKAKRGELSLKAPIGYVNVESNAVYEITPDERVHEAIKLVFRKFFELGSARQTLFWYKSNDVELPSFVFHGKSSEVDWSPPRYSTVQNILTNPVYAGAYAYGKTARKNVYEDGRTRVKSKFLQKDQWAVLIKDHHPGYVTWNEYELIQTMMTENLNRKDIATPGAARKGAALLCGLLRCCRCGRKLKTNYTGQKRDFLRYACFRGYLDNAEPRCIHLSGIALDDAVSEEVLRVIQPGIEKAALEAADQRKMRMSDQLSMLRLELDEAVYAERRAWKQFNLADPENRLVAKELEKRWNEAIQTVANIKIKLSEEQNIVDSRSHISTTQFADIAEHFHEVWNHPHTDSLLKKRLLRTVISEIIIDTFPEEGRTELIIHWQGGVHTALNLNRHKRGQPKETSTSAIQAIQDYILLFDDDFIAGCLNRNGLITGNGLRWTRERVHSIRSHRGIKMPDAEIRKQYVNLTQASEILDVSTTTLRRETEKGFPCIHPLSDGPWIFKREDLLAEQGRILTARAKAKREATGTEHDFHQQNFNF